MSDDPLIRVRRADAPPPEGRIFVPLIQPRPGTTAPVAAIHLGGAVRGVWVHWDGIRSLPCIDGPADQCPGHGRGLPLKWVGYLPAWDPRRQRRVILEVSAHAARTCPALFGPQPSALRGQTVLLRRETTSRRSRIVCELRITTPPVTEGLPADWDPLPVLAHIWGVRRLDWSRGEVM